MANGPINGKMKKAEARDQAFRTRLHSILWRYKNGQIEDSDYKHNSFGTDKKLRRVFELIHAAASDVYVKGQLGNFSQGEQ